MKRMVEAMLIGMGCVCACSGEAVAQAVVGQPAPECTLPDTTGQRRSIADFKGKFIVLEWFNNECPFVGKQYGTGAMQQLQATSTERGVVWLTIVSSAPGKQGYLTPEQGNQVMRERKAHQTAMLLDPDGVVGKRYGAKTTPYLVVINPQGMVIYTGAIDDHPSGDSGDPVIPHNYVERALDEAMAGKPVSMPETRSYGCSVKYK